MKTLRSVGSKKVSDVIVIRNKADNTPLTGVIFGDVTASYYRIGSAPVEISLVSNTVSGAHKSGGFIEIDSNLVPGHYRVDLPDEMFVPGSDSVFYQIKGHTDMNPVDVEIQLQSVVISEEGVGVLVESAPVGKSGAGFYRPRRY